MRNMTQTSFGDLLQQMWHTRPVRLPRQGPIAGVAAGFGQRYNVDPILIRVAFVVSTIFGGAGIVLYLLAWLLLSEPGDQVSAAESLVGKGYSSQSQTKTIVLIVALAIAVSTMGPVGVGLGGSGLISLALMLAGWWMLHLRNPVPPPGTTNAYGEFAPSDGISGYPATGYPGAVFPPGAPRTVGDMYAPPTTVYTPYTKLPDSYVPDVPASESSGADREPSPRRQDTESATDAQQAGADRSEIDTVQLDKPAACGASDHARPHDAATDRTASDAPVGKTAEPAPADDNVRESTFAGNETAPNPFGGTGPAPSSSSVQRASDHAATSLDAETEHLGPTPTSASTAGPALGQESGDKRPPRPNANRPAAFAQTAVIGGPTPPSWDPLGVAPLAWDLPEPTPVRTTATAPPKRPRSRLTPTVIGLAVLAAAAAGAAAAGGVEWMTPGRIGAVALAVIGLGLVLGAFLRRGYGLLVLTAPLAGFVLLASAIGPIEFDRGAMGEHTWAPNSVAELAPSYTVTMGSGTLDLSSLKLTESRTVDVAVQMGEIRVLLPADLTVRTTCTATLGDAQCVNGISGPNTPGAPMLTLNVDVRAGNVEVKRG
ncbi:PspC domain-containing protein [Nocardia sp. NPDC049190]|uniref:PspC domain-containing protein n=1 Tax=Nocardia sp. NPDC049190 TaxID=3155650 RepID=UPI0033F13F80